MSVIPERLWELMTDDEREHVAALVKGWRYEPRVTCPSCGSALGIRLRVSAGAVRVDPASGMPEDTGGAPIAPGEKFAPNEQRILQDADESGMFEAFCNAVREEKVGQVPANLRRFLLTFLQTARLTDVPRYVLDEMRSRYPGTFITFYSGNGVYAVVADSVVREFLPARYVKTRKNGRAMPGALSAAMANPEKQLTEWVRGRFGYVPRESRLFADALRQPTVGSFGRIVQ